MTLLTSERMEETLLLSTRMRVINRRSGHGGVLKRNVGRTLDDHGGRSAVVRRTREDRLEVKTRVTTVMSMVRGNVVRERSDIGRSSHTTETLVNAKVIVPIGTTEIINTVLALVFFDGTGTDDLDFTGHDHGEGFATNGLLDEGKTGAVTPFVEFTTESVGLELEKTKLSGGEEAVTTRRVDISDAAVDDGGLGRSSDLRKVRKESGKVEESAVESLTSLSLYSVMGSPSLCGVCSPGRLALGTVGS